MSLIQLKSMLGISLFANLIFILFLWLDSREMRKLETRLKIFEGRLEVLIKLREEGRK